jgi:uncharacterized protein
MQSSARWYNRQGMSPRLHIDDARLREFCARWKITELALFGSVVRDDFGPDSDVDVLVSFAPEAHWTLLDHVRVRDELMEMFGRSVDLVTRRAVERSPNYLRRREILGSAQVVYGP